MKVGWEFLLTLHCKFFGMFTELIGWSRVDHQHLSARFLQFRFLGHELADLPRADRTLITWPTSQDQ